MCAHVSYLRWMWWALLMHLRGWTRYHVDWGRQAFDRTFDRSQGPLEGHREKKCLWFLNTPLLAISRVCLRRFNRALPLSKQMYAVEAITKGVTEVDAGTGPSGNSSKTFGFFLTSHKRSKKCKELVTKSTNSTFYYLQLFFPTSRLHRLLHSTELARAKKSFTQVFWWGVLSSMEQVLIVW